MNFLAVSLSRRQLWFAWSGPLRAALILRIGPCLQRCLVHPACNRHAAPVTL